MKNKNLIEELEDIKDKITFINDGLLDQIMFNPKDIINDSQNSVYALSKLCFNMGIEFKTMLEAQHKMKNLVEKLETLIEKYQN
jgi:hypothetical protein